MKVAIGQDSHRINYENEEKKLILAGVEFEESFSMEANSDGDVVFHAITNAISGITGKNILGKVSDEMCQNQGIKDSRAYVEEAMKYLKEQIVHISISIECKVPKISPKIEEMKKSIAEVLTISESAVGITATSGEGLTQMRTRTRNCCFCLHNCRIKKEGSLWKKSIEKLEQK